MPGLIRDYRLVMDHFHVGLAAGIHRELEDVGTRVVTGHVEVVTGAENFVRFDFRDKQSFFVIEGPRQNIPMRINDDGTAAHQFGLRIPVRHFDPERLGRGLILHGADKEAAAFVRNVAHRRLPHIRHCHRGRAVDYILHEHILVGFNGFVGVVDDVLETLGARRSVRVSTSHFAAVPYFLHGTDTIITMPRHAAKATAEISPMQYHECPVTYPSYPVELSWRRNSRRDPVLTRLIETFSERLALKL